MVDLKGQYEEIKDQVDSSIQNIIENTSFINGPEVHQFQKELEEYLDVKHVIPCGQTGCNHWQRQCRDGCAADTLQTGP